MLQSIDAETARMLLSRETLEIIDVRDGTEWSSGHLPGARHVPLARLRGAPQDELVHDGVLFVCAAGVRSEVAARLAVERGFSRVYSLSGGTRGWARAGLPLVVE